MRTTVTLAPDVAAEMERLRREEGLGASEALNTLARRGMVRPARPSAPYVHRTVSLGTSVDLTNVAEVLDLLDRDDDA